MTLFHPAARTQKKLRLAIDGPSGSGKTYSALLIAKGLAGGDLAKVALIDTERGSGSLYADLGPFSTLGFEPPYAVKRFVTAHDAAVSEGFEVIIIDSLTHFWSGEGGILDEVDKIAKASKSGNTFAAWKQGSPLQATLIDTMLGSTCHIVATMRSKTEWVLEQNDKGRTVPRKVGLAPDQRKDVEYEYDLVLDLSRDGHVATASKDRTGIFDDRHEVPSEAMGAELLAWLGSAATAPAPTATTRTAATQQPEDPAPPQSNPEPKVETPPTPSNGTLTQAEAERLRGVIAAKGRTPEQILAVLARKGVGDGESLASIPRDQLDGLLEVLASMPDPEPPAAAPAPAAPADDADEPPGMNAEEFRIRNEQQAQDAARGGNARKTGTISPPQLTRLGAQCDELEELGVAREEWRLYMAEKEGVGSRTELTKAAATRLIGYFFRWITDLRTGVIAPGEKIVS